jgi:hypothetical protein
MSIGNDIGLGDFANPPKKMRISCRVVGGNILGIISE